MCLSEKGVESKETGEGVGSVTLHRSENAVEAFLCAYISRFGIELIRIANQFFFKSLRCHVAVRQGKLLTDYIFDG